MKFCGHPFSYGLHQVDVPSCQERKHQNGDKQCTVSVISAKSTHVPTVVYLLCHTHLFVGLNTKSDDEFGIGLTLSGVLSSESRRGRA